LFSERALIEAEMTDVVNKRLSRSDVIDD